MTRPRLWFLLALALSVLTAYAVAGVPHHDFVLLDDDVYLFQNPWTAQGLTSSAVSHHLSSTTGGQYMPVTMISYLPIVWLFGLKAPPQIWFNIAVHIANCVLVVWVLQKYTARFWPSAIVALLLALHPIHVESVAWATERKDVLFMFFGLLTLNAYFNYAVKPGPWRYASTLIFFALSLLSKSMLVTMPFLLLLLDIWPLGRLPKAWSPTAGQTAPPQTLARLLAEKAPFLLLSIAMGLLTLNSTVGVPSLSELPISYRLGVAVTGYADYLRALVWPQGLCALYPIPQFLDPTHVIFSSILLLVITGLALWQWRRRPFLLIGWLWFIITLAPVSGLLQAGNQARADRFVYWPFLGLYIALAWLAASLWFPCEAQPTAPQYRHRVLLAGLAIMPLIITLWALTVRQAGYWSDSQTLFQRILAVTGHNPQISTALGVWYVQKNDLASAQREFLIAISDKPDYLPALLTLAHIYAKTGQTPQALATLDQIASLPGKPDPSVANAALLFQQLGQPQRAISLITRCLNALPNDPVVQSNAGIIYVWAPGPPDQKAQGLAMLQSAASLAPGSGPALTNLGAAYFMLGRYPEAQAQYIASINADPQYLRAYGLLGNLYEKTANPAQAVAVYEAGLTIDPGNPECRAGLARLLTDTSPTRQTP